MARGRVGRVARWPVGDLLREVGDELVADVPVGDGAGDVLGVRQPHRGALAAHLEAHLLEVRLGGVFEELPAHLGGAGEGDRVDIHVPAQRRARVRPHAGDDVQHPRRHARLQRQLGQPQRGAPSPDRPVGRGCASARPGAGLPGPRPRSSGARRRRWRRRSPPPLMPRPPGRGVRGERAPRRRRAHPARAHGGGRRGRRPDPHRLERDVVARLAAGRGVHLASTFTSCGCAPVSTTPDRNSENSSPCELMRSLA